MVALCALLPAGASATTLSATPASLVGVFSSAQAGDTVELASGNYGTFTGAMKSGEVTVKAQADATATIALRFNPAQNIAIDGLTITSADFADSRTKNITVRNSDIPGQTTFRTGELQNANILFDHNVHRDWNACSSCGEGRIWLPENTSQPSGITIQHSEFRGGRSDGIQNGSNGTRILNNSFHDLVSGTAAGVHTDAIQLYGSKNTQIKGNYFHTLPYGVGPIMAGDGANHEIIEDNVFAPSASGDTRPYTITIWSDDGSIIRHNTFVDGSCEFNLRCGIVSMGSKDSCPWPQECDPGRGTIIKDNIIGEISLGSETATYTSSYNLIRSHTPGTNDIQGSPIYLGPLTSYAGHRLAAGSPGKANASDGLDRGIRPGMDPSPAPAPPPPPAPAPPPLPPASVPASNLVAAFGFNETTGPNITDVSGKGNGGNISGATRTSTGKYGRALSFDGVNDYASVPDAASLDLTSGMTLEAWVYPTAGGANWRTALLKETSSGLSYALYAFNDEGRSAGFVNVSEDRSAVAPGSLPLNTWSHLSTTYDGTTVRMYVNGTLANQRTVRGAMATSSRALKRRSCCSRG